MASRIGFLGRRRGDGRLYGTARVGGKGSGTVWQLDISTGLVTTLHEFAADGHEGSGPNALLGDQGHLFGTAQLGGSEGHGTVYRLSLDGGFLRGCFPILSCRRG